MLCLLGKLKSVPRFGGLEVHEGTHRGEYLKLTKVSGGIPLPIEFQLLLLGSGTLNGSFLLISSTVELDCPPGSS